MILTSCGSKSLDPRFDELCMAIHRQWAAACARLGLDRQSAEEAVQDTWTKIIQPEWLRDLARRHESGAFADVGKLQAFLFIVLRNTAIDSLRGRRPAVTDEILGSLAVTARTPEEEVEAFQIAEHVSAFVAKNLRGEDRMIARMYFAEGLSDQAIADRMGATRSAVSGKLKRWRKLLRVILDPFHPSRAGDRTSTEGA